MLRATNNQGEDELLEEAEEMLAGGGRYATNMEREDETGGKTLTTNNENNEDLLACLKCKQFGHLSYQCMNMFARDGKRFEAADAGQQR